MQCYHPITLKTGEIVPCGKCPACLANQRKEWIFRLEQEYLDSNFAIFVTLTYDEKNIPLGHNVRKRDVQLFHKRLRKHFPPGELRFYLVSEYGDQTFRPHYHGLYFFKSNYSKTEIYDIFEKSWSLGFIKFGEVEEGSIVYCTKYCLKHSDTPPGRVKTFRLVSKMNGGLGSRYIREMADYHIESNNGKFVSFNGKVSRMPRYYRTKIGIKIDSFQLFEERYDKAKEEFDTSFKSWLSKHKGLTFAEAVQGYSDYLKSCHDRRDELILKHIKKQKL